LASMATGSISRWARIRAAAENFLQEKGIESEETFGRTRMHRFAHFCLLVVKSFSRNRCPVRASALAYTTLLALVPLLAVGVSITTGMLQKRGEQGIEQLLNQLIAYVAPALDLESKSNGVESAEREKVVKQITGFIGRIKSGTLGVTSVIALFFVGISLLRTIEATFNDIWGITRGRSLVKSIVYYWAVITLGPFFLVAALALATGPHLLRTQAWLSQVPFLGGLVFHLLPFIILSIGFSAFYALMPNTRVHWKAALAGGVVGGSLWQLNYVASVIWVARAVSYTNVYGSLAVFPLLLVGLYFSWLIVLFGAQVAYAFQNREAYIEERQAESVNQRGRDFIALRVMTLVAERFVKGEKPPSLVEISCGLGVPSALVSKLLAVFVNTGLLVEVADAETCYAPARPVGAISVHDVIRALRAGQGHELATKDDPWRGIVRIEFERVLEAERSAGKLVTLEALALNRGEAVKAAT
jgi:membrane protein